jgi:hypothetical protein
MRIIRYSANLQKSWDDFVRNRSRNGTIFHEQRFLSYHGDRFEDCSIMVVGDKKSDILAVIPSAVITEGNKKGIVSHPGSTYGGIIFREDLKVGKLKDVIDVALRYYYSNLSAGFFKVILQEEFHTGDTFCDLVYLLWHRGFVIKSKEASIAKSLKGFSRDDYSKRVSEYIRSRRDVELGIKHAIAVSDNEIIACYEIIKDNLVKKYDKKPTHSIEELLALKKMYGDRLTFFYSEFRQAITGVVVTFELNKKVIHDFYIAQNYAYVKLHPLLWLFDYVLNYFAALGYEYFNFGISSRNRWIKWGILEFKEKFGGKLLTRDVWLLSDMSGTWPHDGAPA